MEEDKIYVKCFGSLSFKQDGFMSSKRVNVKWRTAKAKELFSYLLHHRGRNVSKEALLDLLWSDFNVKAGYAQLYSAIYSIRNNFKQSKLPIKIHSINNEYNLEADNLVVDVNHFKHILNNVEEIKNIEDINKFNVALDLYRAEYFNNEYIWASNEQEYLELLLLDKFMQVNEYYETSNKHTEAINLNIKIKNIFKDFALPYENLKNLYAKLGFKKYEKQYENKLKDFYLDQQTV